MSAGSSARPASSSAASQLRSAAPISPARIATRARSRWISAARDTSSPARASASSSAARASGSAPRSNSIAPIRRSGSAWSGPGSEARSASRALAPAPSASPAASRSRETSRSRRRTDPRSSRGVSRTACSSSSAATSGAPLVRAEAAASLELIGDRGVRSLRREREVAGALLRIVGGLGEAPMDLVPALAGGVGIDRRAIERVDEPDLEPVHLDDAGIDRLLQRRCRAPALEVARPSASTVGRGIDAASSSTSRVFGDTLPTRLRTRSSRRLFGIGIRWPVTPSSPRACARPISSA